MSDPVARRGVTLHEDWTVERTGGSTEPPSTLPGGAFEAVVPGVVHLDLIRAGTIPHPDDGDGEAAQSWVGRSDWRYRHRVSAASLGTVGEPTDDEVLEIVFESIDTVGTVRLGDRILGEVENQFHPHRFAVTRDELFGAPTLAVDLRGPMDELDRRVEQYGDRPVNADGAWGVYSYLRKAACSFGWDWGPMCPGAGLPGQVRLERWRRARIDSVRPAITVCNDRLAVVELAIDLARDPSSSPTARLEVRAFVTTPDGRRIEEVVDVGGSTDVARLRLEIEDPQRWWPRGHGDPVLQDLRVEVRSEGELLDADDRRIGLRIVALDTGRDPEGARFRVVVNGEPIFCRGANWIPDGLFPGTAPDAQIRRRLEQAADAGFNMIRVWGGGVYESNAFHDRCDELGLMVWQDFMFACATYSEEEPFPALVEREARHQVARLASHPSIVLWCGGNENVLAWRNWGWRERMDPAQTWGRRYFTELLPEVVAELDPSRPYLPDSPWSGDVEADPNDPDHGDRHTWDLKVEEVRELVPRFVSEFGHQGPPCRRTIEEAIGVERFADETPEALEAFAARQRGWGGDQAQYDRWLEEWFGPATDLDGRLWRMQLLQARATTFAFEWLRLNQPRCGGALVWQLNDAWTGHSWSLLDVKGRPKPSWWAARQACADRLLAFTVGEAGIEVAGVDDTGVAWPVDGRVRRLDVDGRDLAVARIDWSVPARGVAGVPVPTDIAIPDDPSRELLVAEVGDRRAVWFYGKDAWLSLPRADFEVACSPAGDAAVEVRITATSLVRDLHLDVDRLGPEVSIDRNLETLLPGDVFVATIHGAAGIDESRLRSPGVIRTANGLGAIPG